MPENIVKKEDEDFMLDLLILEDSVAPK